jgi:hypothetical protein
VCLSLRQLGELSRFWLVQLTKRRTSLEFLSRFELLNAASLEPASRHSFIVLSTDLNNFHLRSRKASNEGLVLENYFSNFSIKVEWLAKAKTLSNDGRDCVMQSNPSSINSALKYR